MSGMESGSSGSRLPLAIGGGCAGMALIGIACVGLLVCGLTIPLFSPDSRRAQGTPGPIARFGTPVPAPQPGSGPQPGPGPGPGPQAGPQPGPGAETGPQAGPQPGPGIGTGPQAGPSSGPAGQVWTLARVGGYTCDLNTNQCSALGPGEVFQVAPQGDGTFLVQTGGVALRVDANCGLIDQPGYTLFPCPFFPNVQAFQGVMVAEQGLQPIYSPFQFARIDTDFDQDGVVNEPGYVSHSTSTLVFEAYHENGILKFAGYIVQTQNYAWLYVFIYQAQ
ncbi:MAG: hypothetical protein NZ572_06095 [Thermoflexus sp.]|nr:hypothetical protein [Thermoflexus sp.]